MRQDSGAGVGPGPGRLWRELRWRRGTLSRYRCSRRPQIRLSSKVAKNLDVTILTSDVKNLAAFQFGLQYNPSILKYMGVKEGTFLGSSGRQVNCPDPRVSQDGQLEKLQFNCVTLGPPVSVGGVAGPNGSGVLAVVTFSPVGGGNTPLTW